MVAAGAVLLAGFAFTQRYTTIPLWPRLTATMAVGLLAILVAAGANAATYYLLTLRLAATGHSPAAISLVFLAPAAAVLAAGPIAARLLAHRPPRLVLTLGLATAATGLLLLGATAPIPLGKWPALLIFPLGIGLSLAAAMVTVMAAATDTDRGLLSGLANTAMEVGPPLVLALTAPLAETFGYRTGVLVIAAAPALAALAALAAFTIRRT